MMHRPIWDQHGQEARTPHPAPRRPPNRRRSRPSKSLETRPRARALPLDARAAVESIALLAQAARAEAQDEDREEQVPSTRLARRAPDCAVVVEANRAGREPPPLPRTRRAKPAGDATTPDRENVPRSRTPIIRRAAPRTRSAHSAGERTPHPRNRREPPQQARDGALRADADRHVPRPVGLVKGPSSRSWQRVHDCNQIQTLAASRSTPRARNSTPHETGPSPRVRGNLWHPSARCTCFGRSRAPSRTPNGSSQRLRTTAGRRPDGSTGPHVRRSSPVRLTPRIVPCDACEGPAGGPSQLRVRAPFAGLLVVPDLSRNARAADLVESLAAGRPPDRALTLSTFVCPRPERIRRPRVRGRRLFAEPYSFGGERTRIRR